MKKIINRFVNSLLFGFLAMLIPLLYTFVMFILMVFSSKPEILIHRIGSFWSSYYWTGYILYIPAPIIHIILFVYVLFMNLDDDQFYLPRLKKV